MIIFKSYGGCMAKGRPPKKEASAFGQRLRTLRENSQLTQRDVAESLGISQPSYVSWERKDVGLTESQLRKLAEILSVKVSDLFEDNTQPKQNGPIGRARKSFQQLNELPRSKQKTILDVVDIMMKTKSQTS